MEEENEKLYKLSILGLDQSFSLHQRGLVENGGREQAGERWNASGEQQHGGERVPGRVVHCSERKVGEAAKRNRSSRGREGLAHQIEQGHEADHVGLEATALCRSRHRLAFGPSRQTQSHLR